MAKKFFNTYREQLLHLAKLYNVIEIKKVDDLVDYFTPTFNGDVDLMYNFTSDSIGGRSSLRPLN